VSVHFSSQENELTPLSLKDSGPLTIEDTARRRLWAQSRASTKKAPIQTLLERELRQAMARAGEASLPLYPEARPCARPTTHRLIEVFSSIQRHEVRVGEGEPQVMVTKLTKTQRSIVRPLGLDPRTFRLA
jgi:hypothetical protein